MAPVSVRRFGQVCDSVAAASDEVRPGDPAAQSMVIRRAAAPPLEGRVTSYYGFAEQTAGPVRRREGPGVDVVVILAFDEHWLIDGARHTSFIAGLYEKQVTTEHPGRSLGMQVNLDPLAARALVGMPLHELAGRTVQLEEVFAEPFLVERVAGAPDWATRFRLVDETIASRLADGRPSREVGWAWQRLRATHGRVPIGRLAQELGWSRKRIVARFRDEVGLPPKAVAKLLRFERARRLAGTMPWAELAFECGFYDQSHLVNEFRAITGRSPETFLQDTAVTIA
jgi:AraC-like DNA-binding protein